MRTPPHILYPLPRPHLMWYLLLKLHLINSTPAHPRLYLLLRTPPLPSQCTVVWMWWKMHNPANNFQILFLSWCPTRLSLLFQRPGNRKMSFFYHTAVFISTLTKGKLYQKCISACSELQRNVKVLPQICNLSFWKQIIIITVEFGSKTNIAQGTADPSIECFDSFNTFSSKQKLQSSLKSWSNFSLVLFGKRREIHRTTLTKPCINLNESMYQFWQIHVTT